MTRIALMQPYLFPYLGYFQLIQAVDAFVIYDDVQYMKGGWINRNRILLNGSIRYITLPVKKGHLDNYIRERHFSETVGAAIDTILGQLHSAYRKAPYFHQTMQTVEEAMAFKDKNIASFLTQHLKVVCRDLGIQTPLIVSSKLTKDDSNQTGVDRVLSVCRALNANEYLNPIGGQELYNPTQFNELGIKLYFLQMRTIPYQQFDSSFIPSLSIIDIMMFNSREQIRDLLMEYDLVS